MALHDESVNLSESVLDLDFDDGRGRPTISEEFKNDIEVVFRDPGNVSEGMNRSLKRVLDVDGEAMNALELNKPKSRAFCQLKYLIGPTEQELKTKGYSMSTAYRYIRQG